MPSARIDDDRWLPSPASKTWIDASSPRTMATSTVPCSMSMDRTSPASSGVRHTTVPSTPASRISSRPDSVSPIT